MRFAAMPIPLVLEGISILGRLRHDEHGVAMIVAVMVSFVVLLLGTAAVGQALHDSGSSAYERRGLQSVGAAEAGLNYFYSLVEYSTPASLAASGCAATQELGSAPSYAQFSATITLYDATGVSCPARSPRPRHLRRR